MGSNIKKKERKKEYIPSEPLHSTFVIVSFYTFADAPNLFKILNLKSGTFLQVQNEKMT